MAYIRQLPSGLWAATVRTPAGRITESHRLKGRIEHWAANLESDIRRGEFIDPRAGEITYGELWERTRDARRLEKASKARDESHWRKHVEPRWGRLPIGGVLKPDVSAWVVKMEKDGVGAATIQGAVGVLRGLNEMAIEAKLIRHNPARDVSMPRRPAHVDRVLSPEEDVALLESLDRQFPGRPDARLFCELLLYCGLRWEEAAAIDREHVNMRKQLIHVGPVLERDGVIRPYPKSPAGVRDVPVPDDVWPRLRERVMAVKSKGLVITAVRGTALHYPSWRRRVWQRGLFEVTKRGPRGEALEQVQIMDDPQPTAHDLRHTYLTRLGDAGLPVHDIMRLAGHETLQSAQRYLHAGEDRFDRAREAMRRARGL
jgi:integrase